jgi:hypothetical protein
MLLGFFLATVETSITATALVSIGEYFNDSFTVLKSSNLQIVQPLTLNQATWVVLSYLLSYMGSCAKTQRSAVNLGSYRIFGHHRET